MQAATIIGKRCSRSSRPRGSSARSTRPRIDGRGSKMMQNGKLVRTLAVAAFVAGAAQAAFADAASDFYASKNLSLIAGFPPGGGYDAYVRTLARHFGRLLPGHPTIVPSNMPGAGSLLAANYLYGKAPPDGTVL